MLLCRCVRDVDSVQFHLRVTNLIQVPPILWVGWYDPLCWMIFTLGNDLWAGGFERLFRPVETWYSEASIPWRINFYLYIYVHCSLSLYYMLWLTVLLCQIYTEVHHCSLTLSHCAVWEEACPLWEEACPLWEEACPQNRRTGSRPTRWERTLIYINYQWWLRLTLLYTSIRRFNYPVWRR